MRLHSFLVAISFVCAGLYQPTIAFALPSFARQTGMECSSCHTGSFGPQLNSFGRSFKLNGYVLGEMKNKLKNLSAMVVAGVENTAKDLRKGFELPAGSSLDTNNNVSVDQTSLFYGGAITSHVGLMAQATYNGPDRTLSWDNADLRYANTTKLAGKSFIYGVTANNNPSVQDLWQTTPAWQFPFTSSAIAPTPNAGPYMASLGQAVGGLGVYSMWDDLFYAELAGYSTLGDDFQQTMGLKGVSTSDHLRGIAPYWRLAVQHNGGQQYFSVGTFGMSSNRLPGNVTGFGTDNMLDYALDGTYQFTSKNGKHNLSLYGVALHERQDLSATFPAAARPTGMTT